MLYIRVCIRMHTNVACGIFKDTIVTMLYGAGMSDHPCNDVAKGERLLKDICELSASVQKVFSTYTNVPGVGILTHPPLVCLRVDEALRAGPGWNKTLLAVVYDDAGGTYDHVIPPHEGVPADESPCNIGNPPAVGDSGPKLERTYPADEASDRLLNEEEVSRAMDGRWKGRLREGGAPIPSDGSTWSLLNTFDHATNLISFAYTGHPDGTSSPSSSCGAPSPPPGSSCADWLRIGYYKAPDGLPFEFHAVKGAAKPLTFKLKESWPYPPTTVRTRGRSSFSKTILGYPRTLQ